MGRRRARGVPTPVTGEPRVIIALTWYGHIPFLRSTRTTPRPALRLTELTVAIDAPRIITYWSFRKGFSRIIVNCGYRRTFNASLGYVSAASVTVEDSWVMERRDMFGVGKNCWKWNGCIKLVWQRKWIETYFSISSSSKVWLPEMAQFFKCLTASSVPTQFGIGRTVDFNVNSTPHLRHLLSLESKKSEEMAHDISNMQLVVDWNKYHSLPIDKQNLILSYLLAP